MADTMVTNTVVIMAMKNKNKKKIWLLVIILLLLLLGIGVFLYIERENDPISTDFTENEREDAIIYGGKEYEYNDQLSNYLFLGVDVREPIERNGVRGEAGQADAIYLVSYNRVQETIKVLAIPRDTIADIAIYAPDGTALGSNKDHLNIQYAFGDGGHTSCDLMRDAVSKMLYDVPIQGYCSLYMEGIPTATEVLGGVELVVPDDTLIDVNPEYKKGATITVTKENAERFVRYRDTAESQSAIDRMNRQKTFIRAFADKAVKVYGQDPGFIADLYDSLEDYMVTNMSNDIFADLLTSKNISGEKIQNLPGEGVDGERFDEYHINEDQLYELVLQMFYKEV